MLAFMRLEVKASYRLRFQYEVTEKNRNGSRGFYE